MLRRRPGSPDELLAIRGIGPAFVEKHGDDLLAVLGSL
ncbi:MAG: HRDC domain-containing protein [Actinobacteria bacterium]|nr:HRDC domain-containing protein [Actinomycetota bacterium]